MNAVKNADDKTRNDMEAHVYRARRDFSRVVHCRERSSVRNVWGSTMQLEDIAARVA